MGAHYDPGHRLMVSLDYIDEADGNVSVCTH